LIKIRAKKLSGVAARRPGGACSGKNHKCKNPILSISPTAKKDEKRKKCAGGGARAGIGNRHDSQDARAANPPGGGRQAAPSKVRKEQRKSARAADDLPPRSVVISPCVSHQNQVHVNCPVN
jgi:hypothetical protein